MSDRSQPPVLGRCPHGDPTCPCPDEPAADYCHYEGGDAMVCPNPVLGIKGLTNPHCHMEGCDWHVEGCSPDLPVQGACGLIVKLGLPPLEDGFGGEFYSMTQARPGLPGWACGWLRTPLNVANREVDHERASDEAPRPEGSGR